MWEAVFTFTAVFMGLRFFLMLFLQKITERSEKKRLVNPMPIHEVQRNRESMWPIGIVMDTVTLSFLFYWGVLSLDLGPFWACFGVMVLTHVGVVEPIYYFYHRLLHTSWFYKHYHIYHHKSVIIDPFTSMSFTLTERYSYTILFSIPVLAVYWLGLFDFRAFVMFYLLFDFINSLGHLNIKLEPSWYKKSRVIKWLVYSPEYHEKHHSLFTQNYALFMPIFDKIFHSLASFNNPINEAIKKD